FIPCLPGSTFESADGDFITDVPGARDWATVNGTTGYSGATDLPSGATDNSFTEGTKEDDQTVVVATGSIPPNKDDLTHFAIFTEDVNASVNTGCKVGPAINATNCVFVYLLWERTNQLGSAHRDHAASRPAVRRDRGGEHHGRGGHQPDRRRHRTPHGVRYDVWQRLAEEPLFRQLLQQHDEGLHRAGHDLRQPPLPDADANQH